jgi:uncharacterized protein YgiM (DUF1202 family)
MRHSCRQLATGALLIAVCAAGASCGSGRTKSGETVIAEAWTGPINLNLRAELDPRSKNVATTHHGQKLEVLQIRRRFVRVRTEDGKQGWTEMRNLMSTEQIQALGELAASAKKLPSQGSATVYEPLNVHTEPSRPSTSFYQIREGMKVEVLDQRLVERNTTPPPPSIQVRKPAPRTRRTKKEPAIPPPPRPPAPLVPADWRELSVTNLPPPPPEPEIPGRRRPAAPKKVLEDWSLVRTADGHAGWVLSRNLVMAIPDEVAQYSEGARITSYFPLAEVRDAEAVKHHWLWTTMRQPGQPYQFDSFRVFVYVARRHRYETAYIERRIEGYYPVEVTPGATPRFSLIIRGEDGNLYRKSYVLEGYNVRKVGEQQYEMPKDRLFGPPSGEPEEEPDNEDGEEPGRPLMERIRGLFARNS